MKRVELHDAEYWINRPMDSEKDWVDDQPDWVESYVHSDQHPHRELILNAIRSLNPKKILEIGCGSGSNLLRIHEIFSSVKLFGLDVSDKLIKRARDYLPGAVFKVGTYLTIPYASKSFDLVLADATLMYISPEHVDQAMTEMNRVTRQAIVIVDRFNKSPFGVRSGHVWARNYPIWLEDFGYQVTKTKITKEHWPNSVGWQKHGYLFVATK